MGIRRDGVDGPPPRIGSGRLIDRLTGEADRLDMAEIGATATAHHIQARASTPERRKLAAKFNRVAVIEIGRVVELGMAAPRRVGPQPFDPPRPVLARPEKTFEMSRMGAVDHVVSRQHRGRPVDGLDRLPKTLPARQIAVGLERKEMTTGIFASAAARTTPIASST